MAPNASPSSSSASLIAPQEIVEAVQFGRLETFLAFLHTHEKDLSPLPIIDKEGCSLLHWAAINNRLSYIHMLLDKGADINISGGNLAESPLHWAVRDPNHHSIVLDLLQRGADYSFQSNLGMDALQVAVRSGNVNISYLLLLHGARVDVPDNEGDTALLYLMKNLHAPHAVDLIRLLLTFKADLSFEDAMGNNSLHILCGDSKRKESSLLTLLVKYGDPKLRVSSNSKTKQTAYSLLNSSSATYSAANYQMRQFLFDWMVFSSSPLYLSTMSHALATFLFFLTLHFYGYLISVITLIVTQYLAVFLSTQSIQIKLSRSTHGNVYGLISGLVMNFMIHMSPKLSFPVNAVLNFCIFMIYYCLYLSANTKPCKPIVQDR